MFNDISSGFQVFCLTFHFVQKTQGEIQRMFIVFDFHRKIEKQLQRNTCDFIFQLSKNNYRKRHTSGNQSCKINKFFPNPPWIVRCTRVTEAPGSCCFGKYDFHV